MGLCTGKLEVFLGSFDDEPDYKLEGDLAIDTIFAGFEEAITSMPGGDNYVVGKEDGEPVWLIGIYGVVVVGKDAIEKYLVDMKN